MNLRAIRFLTITLALGLLTGGCVRSEQPLSTRAAARPDPRLVGTWHAVGKNDGGLKDVQASFDQRGIGHLLIAADNSNFAPSPDLPEFFVTRTQRNSYLNVRLRDDARKGFHWRSKHYKFYKYQFSRDQKTVRLWSLRADPFERAITAGKLKGVLAKDDHGSQDSSTTLQDSSEAILSFIESTPDGEIFEKYGTFRRVR